jgi:hypothetical protein
MTTSAMFTRRSALALGAGAALVPRSLFAAPARSAVLVELFTSQGCSSCPAADKMAAELVKNDSATVVSFNVDYWDYLGWRDTLAKPEYSQRQYDYAKHRGDSSVYTPQMIVNGKTHAVGSKRSNVMAEIEAASAPPVPIKLKMTEKEVTVEIAASTFKGDATLWLMAVEAEVVQKIERGENAGHNIAYVNVVRQLIPAAMWQGQAYSGSWMRDAVMSPGTEFCLAVLQESKVGPVLGMAKA